MNQSLKPLGPTSKLRSYSLSMVWGIWAGMCISIVLAGIIGHRIPEAMRELRGMIPVSLLGMAFPIFLERRAAKKGYPRIYFKFRIFSLTAMFFVVSVVGPALLR